MPTASPEHVDAVFKALASRPRREILRLLATSGTAADGTCCAEEVCACVFAEKLGLGAPTVSHHMKSLIDAGLVSANKRGLWVYYRIVPEAFAPLVAEFSSYVNAAGCGCGPTDVAPAPACNCLEECS
jgi:ArsR family transcriptional regulator, arsenate/arsenite/antimonite-responsive transcriptional repressor